MIQDSSDDEDEVSEEMGTFSTFEEMMRKRKQVVDDVKPSSNQWEKEAPLPEVTSQNKMAEEVGRSEEVKKDEEEEYNLQLYAFVARCIAYPFGARYKHETTHRPPKLSLFQLEMARDRFKLFLEGESKIPTDEAFNEAVDKFYTEVLMSTEVTRVVHGAGWCVMDFTEIFKSSILEVIRALPDFKNLSKQTLIDAWMERFELIFRGETEKKMLPIYSTPVLDGGRMAKDQLFEMFQKVLKVRRRQHQILSNLMQLDNADEQAAQVRRELDQRLCEVQSLQKTPGLAPKCLTKVMDAYFTHEMELSITNLKVNLQKVPVLKNEDNAKDSGENKLFQHKDDDLLSKHDLVLNFHVQTTIKDIKGLDTIPPSSTIFCVFEMDGCHKLSTPRCCLDDVSWDVQADFLTSFPVTSVKVKLCQEVNGFLGVEDKEIAKVVLPCKLSADCPSNHWCNMVPIKNPSHKNISINLVNSVEKPHNVKCFGELYSKGKNIWKKWKERYFLLIQVSQFTFVLCSYTYNKSSPTRFIAINNNYTIDYCEDTYGQEEGLAYFMMTKEEEEIVFATKDESSLLPWVQSLYRATGQTFKPHLLNNPSRHHSMLNYRSERDKSMKKLLDKVASTRPSQFDQQKLFLDLQNLTLSFRLNDSFTCTYGWLSADQMFVLDEYCHRYGVRPFERHMGYLDSIIDHGMEGCCIDPSLFYQKFSFCVAHIHGNKPADAYTVTIAEMDKFIEVSTKLYSYLEHSITNFRSSFPFGRPSGGLKISLNLLERVKRELIYFEEVKQEDKDHYVLQQILAPVDKGVMDRLVEGCLSRGCLDVYIDVCRDLCLEEVLSSNNDTATKDTMFRVAKECVCVTEQAFTSHKESLDRSVDLLWDMYSTDLTQLILSRPLTSFLWEYFELFQFLNEYLLSHDDLNGGPFHIHLCQLFAPICIHYLSSMQLSIHQSIQQQSISIHSSSIYPSSIYPTSTKEEENGDNSPPSLVDDTLWKLESLSTFICDLNWPEEEFKGHLDLKVKLIAKEACLECSHRMRDFFFDHIKRLHTTNDLLLDPHIYFAVSSLCKLKNLYSWNGELHTQLHKLTETFISMIVEKLTEELKRLLKWLSMFDPSSLTSVVFSLMNTTDDRWRAIIDLNVFVHEQIPCNVKDEEFCSLFMQTLNERQTKILFDWLENRKELDEKQVLILQSLWANYQEVLKDGEVTKATHFNEVNLRIQAESFLKSTSAWG